MKIWKNAKNAYLYLLDFLFPKSQIEMEVEKMSLRDLEEARLIAPLHEKMTLCFLEYKDPSVRTAILDLKQRGSTRTTRMLAEAIYDDLVDELSELSTFENFNDPILIPVPLSTKRRKQRGFNQTELLCLELAGIDPELFKVETRILIKTKETIKQSLLKEKSEREQNLDGCFAVVRPEKIRGRNIILLDDVITTGSTMREAEKTLIKNGAKKVLKIACAH